MKKKKDYFLKDNAGFSFPVAVDDHCRSHIFNARDLCIVKELADLRKNGISVVRLDLRRYSSEDSAKIISIYKKILRDVNGGRDVDSNAYLGELQKIMPHGFTKGHFYRGV